MIGQADANYAARLDLEENSLTRIKNVHIFNKAVSKETLLNLVDRLTGYEYYDYEPWVQWNNSDMQWTL